MMATAKNGATGTSILATAASTPSSSRSELIASQACNTSECLSRSLTGSAFSSGSTSLFAEFSVAIIASIENYVLNVNSQDSVNIEPHQILHLILKLFVFNGRKASSALASILPNMRRVSDKQEKGQAGEGGP